MCWTHFKCLGSIRIHTTARSRSCYRRHTSPNCGALVVTFWRRSMDDPVYEPELNQTPMWKNTKDSQVCFESRCRHWTHPPSRLNTRPRPLVKTDIGYAKLENYSRQRIGNESGIGQSSPHPNLAKRLWRHALRWREVPDPNAVTLIARSSG